MPDTHLSNRIISSRYVIKKQLGSGGMADIFLARDIVLERLVAIKRLRKDYSFDENFQQRFILEAKAAANLTHPNIVTIFDFGFDNGMPFIVMEYVQGEDLKSIINSQKIIDTPIATKLITQACAGIGYAHRAGLVHCDIKPQNMLVTSDHTLKVTDFGISRALASILPNEQHDVVWGSPYYLSPEQASGLAPSPASDVYSLGVVLYEMVTGALPFSASNANDLMEQHKNSIPVNPKTINPKIPDQLVQILEKILSKNPANRYRTADQLGRVLSNIIENPNQKFPSIFPPLPIPDQNKVSKLPDVPSSVGSGVDWKLVGLSLLTLISVGGLVPFWLYIYLSLFNPLR